MAFRGGLRGNKQLLRGKNSFCGREEAVDSTLLLVTTHSSPELSFPVYQLRSNREETEVFERSHLISLQFSGASAHVKAVRGLAVL